MSAIFPITEREAAVLHDLGWQSGYGWRSEWDWWPSDAPIEAASDEGVRLRLMHSVTCIRSAVAAGEELAKRVLSAAKAELSDQDKAAIDDAGEHLIAFAGLRLPVITFSCEPLGPAAERIYDENLEELYSQ